MKPVYGEKIIVGIINETKFNWYILDVDDCYLDYRKQAESFGMTYENRGERGGIDVVDLDTKEIFLEYIRTRLIESQELREMLKLTDSFDDKLPFQESVFINFDTAELFNKYYEPNAFEEMIPTGWIGKYCSFSKFVPEVDRYWIDDGNNLMWEGYNE